jgi:cell division septum initiation protein DivIVA
MQNVEPDPDQVRAGALRGEGKSRNMVNEARTRADTMLHDARTRAETLERQSQEKTESLEQDTARKHTDILDALSQEKRLLGKTSTNCEHSRGSTAFG